MLCVRTRKHELLLCSEATGAFAICVVQDPSPEEHAVPLVFSKAAASLKGSVIAGAQPGVRL